MNFKIDEKTRLDFDKMMRQEGVQDNTQKIRNLKHSQKIREQVEIMVNIKKKYTRLDKKMMDSIIDSKCSWLFKNYSNIFLKLKKEQLNLQILDKFLETLSEIEDGNLDQHEGSVKVGQLLKEMYIDSAMRNKQQQEERDKKQAKQKKTFKRPVNKISWNEYKKMTQMTQ